MAVNVAGKVYAMNVVTPVAWYQIWINKLIFWVALRWPAKILGLLTLSIIHYARWTILKPNQFPHLDPSQPKETIKYGYMFFFSNFNSSWAQYVDSFTFAIPDGLNAFWRKNILYPQSVPSAKFQEYIWFNQIQTSHYYSAYPMATSNDVKGSQALKEALTAFDTKAAHMNADDFMNAYDELVQENSLHLSYMHKGPVMSIAQQEIIERREAA